MNAPLGSGSVSMRLYPHDTTPAEVIRLFRDEARRAEEAGFDGVMISEHHGGFAGYMPNPILISDFVLDATERIWAAPSPIVLPIRAASQVAEDLAWIAVRHRGRLGAGFCAGGLALDFEMADVDFERNAEIFKASLPVVVRSLRGEAQGALAADPAVAATVATPVPAVSAASSPAAVRRAAGLGVGVLYDSLQTVDRTRRLSDEYRAAGGTEAAIAIRRVWVGPPPSASVEVQMDRYRGYASAGAMKHWGSDELISGADGVELAQAIAAFLETGRCDAVNLRIHLAGLTPAQISGQIDRHAAETLPELRRLLDS
jgi:alkanesulfonate monooxygenase SsuD/methylene tetrahydromethanopterin reductase-like flavin-dependent oxidoreductase (luciferase family)